VRAGDGPLPSGLDLAPSGCHRIAPCRSRSGNLKEDLEDLGSKFDGAPNLEFRMATGELELEQSGF
jgi:hypothetical protein